MLKKAACVTAWVSAVMRSCCWAVRIAILESKQVRISVIFSQELLGGVCVSRCGMMMSGCPDGETLGPCREWQQIMSMSDGRCFSKAAISGALQEVWPPTMAPCFVAVVVACVRALRRIGVEFEALKCRGNGRKQR